MAFVHGYFVDARLQTTVQTFYGNIKSTLVLHWMNALVHCVDRSIPVGPIPTGKIACG